ncbi:MAG: hypothetical protein IKD31_04630 [Clostridia bacterium]|nr:hypothetical protein [Clostridia bacterium]
MNRTLFHHYRKLYRQAFVPIFVKDEWNTETLLEGCRLAGVEVIEYTLRREDAACVIPTLKQKYPEFTVVVGSTIDSAPIVSQMKAKVPQLMTLEELAPFTDGFVSMLPFSDETLSRYAATHLMFPTAQTGGEALRQMRAGATFIKVLGPDFSFSKSLHAAPTFDYCPTFLTGGVTLERMEEAFACGNELCASGFDVILRGIDPKEADASLVAERLALFTEAAKRARGLARPSLSEVEKLSDEEFLKALPHYCSVI